MAEIVADEYVSKVRFDWGEEYVKFLNTLFENADPKEMYTPDELADLMDFPYEDTWVTWWGYLLSQGMLQAHYFTQEDEVFKPFENDDVITQLLQIVEDEKDIPVIFEGRRIRPSDLFIAFTVEEES